VGTPRSGYHFRLSLGSVQGVSLFPGKQSFVLELAHFAAFLPRRFQRGAYTLYDETPDREALGNRNPTVRPGN